MRYDAHQMRTTVAIDDNLLAAAKARAHEVRQTLGQLIEEALRRELGRQPARGPRPTIPVFSEGTGPQPGVDLGSTRAMIEVLDEGTPLDRLR